MKKSPYVKCIINTIIPMFTITIIFIILDEIFSTNEKRWLDGNAWSTIIIGIISSTATIVLGYISYWQNKQQREDYRKAEEENKIKFKKEEEKRTRQKILEIYQNSFYNYIDILNEIDKSFSEKNLPTRILWYKDRICNDKNLMENPDNKEFIIEYKKMLSSTIYWINHIYNRILYQPYYTNKLNNCVNSIVNLRYELEDYIDKNINSNIYNSCIEKININEFGLDTKKLMIDYFKFQDNWEIYYQYTIRKLEDLLLDNDVNTIENWIENNKVHIENIRMEIFNIEKNRHNKTTP